MITELTKAEKGDKLEFTRDLVKSFVRIQKGKKFRVWYRENDKVESPLVCVDGKIVNNFLESFHVKVAFDETPTSIDYISVEQIILLDTSTVYDLRNDMFKRSCDVTETEIFKYLTDIDEKRKLITVIAKCENYKIIRAITGRIDIIDAGIEQVIVRHDDSPSQCTEIGFGEIMAIQEIVQNEDSIEFSFINGNLWRSTNVK